MKSLFSNILASSQIKDDSDSLQYYGKDWCKELIANPSLILMPNSESQISEILRICNTEKISVVPSGGRTGTCGGATATNNEVVVSLEKLNKIISFDSHTPAITCQAGVVTKKIQEKVEVEGWYFPVDFASSGSSQIGGNIATNAGGVRVLKYGCIKDWVLGLRVVLANGEVLDLDQNLIKDQAGYNLKSLFIGSEGTLGVITQATLKLISNPNNIVRFFVALNDSNKMLETMSYIRSKLANISMCEFVPRAALEIVLDHASKKDLFNSTYEIYLLFESELNEYEKIQKVLEKAFKENLISDVIMSQSEKQADEFLEYRESIPEILGSKFFIHRFDIACSVPIILEFIQAIQETAKHIYPDFKQIYFGHLGDGNVHFDLLKPEHVSKEDFVKTCKAGEEKFYQVVKKFGGSVAAEHGVGLMKKPHLENNHKLQLMRDIKGLLDPNNILNPGKIF